MPEKSDNLLERVKVRLGGAEVEEGFLDELITTVRARLCIRLGENQLPNIFDSVCVDATIKMFRRVYYEGISSEGVANISTSFVEDILNEYAQEIGEWKLRKSNGETGSGRIVRFL